MHSGILQFKKIGILSKMDYSLNVDVQNITLHVAIPAMNEEGWIEHTLETVFAQRRVRVHVWICVNQPDRWWQDPEKRPLCLANQRTLAMLTGYKNKPLTVIDRSSPGLGWAP